MEPAGQEEVTSSPITGRKDPGWLKPEIGVRMAVKGARSSASEGAHFRWPGSM